MDIRAHVIKRGVDPSLHRFWVDDAEGVATFPLLTQIGKMVGYQQYRPSAGKERKNHPRNGRYYTYTTKTARGVWGMESWLLSRTLFITEGIFGAARLTRRGCAAVALISNDPKHLSDWLFCVRMSRPVVAICDHGKAGIKLAKFGSSFQQMPEAFDLDDAPEDFVTRLIEKHCKGNGGLSVTRNR